MILNWKFIWGIFRLEFFTILLNKAILNDLLAILCAFPPPLFPRLKKHLATDAPPALSCHHSSVPFTYIPTASFHFADPFFEWHIPPTTTDSFVYHSTFPISPSSSPVLKDIDLGEARGMPDLAEHLEHERIAAFFCSY